VSNRLPTVTIIIPARPGESRIQALEAVRTLDYPRTRLEMIVARGKQPSVQRNVAIKAARGELIYFLDDDARPAPESLRRAVSHFTDPRVKLVGGPAVCPKEAPWIEQVFAVVLGSWLAFGPSRARYTRVGSLRESSEKELILCNMVMRRDTFVELGGFDESLYPNEENALMDDIQTAGGKLLYDPDVLAERRPRPNLKSFVKMLLTYGRGRAEQFRLHPGFGSALNLIPPLFCLYLLVWPLIASLIARFIRHGNIIVSVGTLPMVLFVGVVLLGAVGSIRQHGLLRSIAAMPLVALTPVLYGLGFWRGLFTRVHGKGSQQVEVVLEQVRW
jgi:succinoglycan biosynthesis protein ExoA